MEKEALVQRIKEGIIFLGELLPEWLCQNDFLYESHISLPAKDIVKKAAEQKGSSRLMIVESKELEKWAGIMESQCLKFGEDYLDDFSAHQLFLSVMGNSKRKKLAVMYGNCQMHDYFDSLNMQENFKMEYDSVYFKYLEYPRWKEVRLELLLTLCDVLIYTKEGFDEKFRNVRVYVEKYNSSCRKIFIPTYSFRGCFPQTNPLIQAKGEFDIVAELFNSFHREDKYINKLIQEGKTLLEIQEKIQTGGCFSEEKVKCLLEISLKQIETMDRLSNVKIYPFILENYKKIRLFKDPVHMENVLVWHVAGQISQLLGLEQKESVPEKTIHYFTQLPVYPEVKEWLELEWPEKDYEPEIRLKEGMIQVTVNEFVEKYWDFAHQAWGILHALTVGEDRKNVKEWFDGYGN